MLQKRVGEVLDKINGLFRQPTVENISGPSDCGYQCISAVFASRGQHVRIDELKELCGRTSRGLTLRQLRDAFRKCGVQADAIFFDKEKPGAMPCPSVILYGTGHFVAVTAERGESVYLYDSTVGWTWMKRSRLLRKSNGLAIELGDELADLSLFRPRHELDTQLHREIKKTFSRTSLRRPIILYVIAQISILTLPILTMFAVDGAATQDISSTGLLVLLGFVLLTALNTLISLAGELAQISFQKRIDTEAGRTVFNALARKSAQWHANQGTASVQHRLGSFAAIVSFKVQVVRSLVIAAMSGLVGLTIMFFISLWLLLPGLIALLVTVVIDLSFQKKNLETIATSVEARQRQQAFVLGAMGQLPTINRFGAAKSAGAQYRHLVRRASIAAASQKVVQGWRQSVAAVSKAAENLIFLSIAAYFFGGGAIAIGGFVALAAYKDLLAQSLTSLFKLSLQRQALAVHRIQSAEIFTKEPSAQGGDIAVAKGAVYFERVTFAYGDLDKPVLSSMDFRLQPGSMTVLCGQSGAGKSTIMKLLSGQLAPSSGRVLIDGKEAWKTAVGLSAVLQDDRLIDGSIRENIVFFRRHIDDEQIFRALEIACLSEFVSTLPMGLNTHVGEASGGVSGGQRQRILLARAVLVEPKLLLLDEATASLDVVTEKAIFCNLRGLTSTILAVAHRPEVWELADNLVELSADGSTVQFIDDEPRLSSSQLAYTKRRAGSLSLDLLD